MKEQLKIVRRRHTNSSLLSPTVVGIFESYADGNNMIITDRELSEQLTQSSECDSVYAYDAPPVEMRSTEVN